MDVQTFLKSLEDQVNLLLRDFPSLEKPNRAFTAWCLTQILGISEDEAVDCVVDGHDDKGIDAIYIPEEGQTLVLAQTKRFKKTDRNFPASDVIKVINGVDWLIEGNLEDVANPSFRAKAEEFRDAYTRFLSSRVAVYLIGICKPPAADGEQEIAKFLEKRNTMATTFSFEVCDLERLFEVYRSRLFRRVQIDTVLDLCDQPYERESKGTRAIVGSVRGKQLAQLFVDYGDAIFESNIRNYLGNVKINKQIMKTASDERDAGNFWFYNNGVTFVCDELSFRSSRDLTRVQLKGAQIINGCQTVTSLYRAVKEGNLKNEVEVLVRIIELPDPGFIRQVTLYTNSQNAVRTSDLVGTDAIQLDLQRRLRSLGYFYETRRGDFKAKYPRREDAAQEFGEQFRDKIIRLVEAAQALAAFYLEKPAVAKSKTSSLFVPSSEAGYYEELFNAETTPEHIIGTVTLLRAMTEKRKEVMATNPDEKWSWLPHADYFLLSLFHRRFFDASRHEDVAYVNKFFKAVQSRFEELYWNTGNQVADYMAHRPTEAGYSHPKFFKSQTSYEELAQQFKKIPIAV